MQLIKSELSSLAQPLAVSSREAKSKDLWLLFSARCCQLASRRFSSLLFLPLHLARHTAYHASDCSHERKQKRACQSRSLTGGSLSQARLLRQLCHQMAGRYGDNSGRTPFHCWKSHESRAPSLPPISSLGRISRSACSSTSRPIPFKTRKVTICPRRLAPSIPTSTQTTGRSAPSTSARATSYSSPSTRAASACGRLRRPNTASATHRGNKATAMCSQISPRRAGNADSASAFTSRRATTTLVRAWEAFAKTSAASPHTTQCIAAN